MAASLRERVYTLLQECSKKKEKEYLSYCRYVYSLMIKSGLDSISVLSDKMIRVFGASGSLEDANYVFYHVSKTSIFTWNCIMSAYIGLGQDHRAINLFSTMLEVPILPDAITFSTILQACVNVQDVQRGRCIHTEILARGVCMDVVADAILIGFYSELGTLEEACWVFHNMPYHDMVSWSAMMKGFQHHHDGHASLACFQCMCDEGLIPNNIIFLLALKACTSIRDIAQGMVIHDAISKVDIITSTSLYSVIIDMYSKCGYLEDARNIFERSGPRRDATIWSVMINGYAVCQKGQLALELYRRMLKEEDEDIMPDESMFLCVLKACGTEECILDCLLIHNHIICTGVEYSITVGNTLVDTYAKCGSLFQAHKIFCEMPKRDVVTWSTIISGYVQQGEELHALNLFVQMQAEDVKPTKTVISCILKACGNLGALQEGFFIHDFTIKLGLDDDSIIGNTFVYIYSKCQCLKEAHNMFGRLLSKDVVSSSALICGYIENGKTGIALELFRRVLLQGVKPDKGIYICSLNACCDTQNLPIGRMIHYSLISIQEELDFEAGRGLLGMYIRCGSLQDAHSMFESLIKPDIVMLGTLILGYCEHGLASLALELFEKMQESGMQPDQILLSNVLRACCDLGAVEKGRVLHSQITEMEFDPDAGIRSSIVHFYIKCACIQDACKVFMSLQDRDSVSWGTMVSGYALHGNCEMANLCLKEMQKIGCEANDVLFTGILTACTHSGLLEDGCNYFKHMREHYGIIPNIKHYDSILDLFGRAGHLELASDLIQTIPIPPNDLGWTSLLTGWRTYGSLDACTQLFRYATKN